MTYRSDFEVFVCKATGKLVAYTTFDPALVSELRQNTTAKFGDRSGRKAWTLDADSRTVANFRAAVADAAERAAAKAAPAAKAAAQKAAPAMSREQAERAFDRGVNEGGEGYNPYRQGAAHTYAGRA